MLRWNYEALGLTNWNADSEPEELEEDKEEGER